MRIFKLFFGGLTAAIILLIIAWYGREKLLLTLASYRLRNDVAELRKIAFDDNNYGNCIQNLDGYQLRFTSETDYVIEATCDSNFEQKSILTGTLFGGVRKTYGSGILIQLDKGVPLVDDAWVFLVYGESQVAVGLFDGQAKVVWETDDLEIGGTSPAWGSCSDWGFNCCVRDNEVGEGTRVRTYDCANNCYEKCDRLPIVLLFNSEPLLNQKTRTVVLSKNNPVIKFGLEVSDDQGFSEIRLDFGDGDLSPLLAAKTTDQVHEYKCNQIECYFKAKVIAKDDAGNGLVESKLNEMMIVIR